MKKYINDLSQTNRYFLVLCEYPKQTKINTLRVYDKNLKNDVLLLSMIPAVIFCVTLQKRVQRTSRVGHVACKI